jgi:hypothetical protein
VPTRNGRHRGGSQEEAPRGRGVTLSLSPASSGRSAAHSRARRGTCGPTRPRHWTHAETVACGELSYTVGWGSVVRGEHRFGLADLSANGGACLKLRAGVISALGASFILPRMGLFRLTCLESLPCFARCIKKTHSSKVRNKLALLYTVILINYVDATRKCNALQTPLHQSRSVQ